MIKTYIKFLINGGSIALLAWILQVIIFELMGNTSPLAYGTASAIAVFITSVLNFYLQKSWVFHNNAIVRRYLVIELLNFGLISMFSPLVRGILNQFFIREISDILGFGVSAIIISIPVFIFKRKWVFQN